MSNIFPLMVYRKGGHCQCPGGNYSWHCVKNMDELEKAAKEGYYPTIDLAMEKPSDFSWDKYAESAGWLADDEPDEESDEVNETRAALEAQAKELGIGFNSRTSNAKLAEKIESAKEAPEAGDSGQDDDTASNEGGSDE